MLCDQVGSLVASLVLAIPFMQDCAVDPGGAVEDELPVGQQPCCQQSGSPGCEEPEVVACVCERDDYCCDVRWDGTCVGEADEFCKAECD